MLLQLKSSKSRSRNQKKESQFSSSSSEEEIPADDTSSDEISDEKLCLVCGAPGKDEMWYRWTMCGLWTHSECVGFKSAKN